MTLATKYGGVGLLAIAVGFGWPPDAAGAFRGAEHAPPALERAPADPAAQDRGAADAEPVEFRWVGTTAHAWGAWVTPGAAVEDWVDQAIALCAGEDLCEINVFDGSEHATHEIPVPEANRAGLKWVLRYRRNGTPRVVVEEVRAEPGREPRTWTFDR